ncbi:MAG: UvrD-helicase domain-containing protein, partial [Coriobacteriia bacterium]|nr:UvrD-helicase domain-containing protein [Coriobacteriia bacterium]
LDGDQAQKLQDEILTQFIAEISLPDSSTGASDLDIVRLKAMTATQIEMTLRAAKSGALYASLLSLGSDQKTIASQVRDIVEQCARFGRTLNDVESQPIDHAYDDEHRVCIIKAMLTIELARRFSVRYTEVKRDRAVMDFDDLITTAHTLLATNERVREHYRERFDYLLVDEFQDTNPFTYRIVDMLARDNLCLVGDAKQSIFGFNGADVSLISTLTEAWDTDPATQIIPLSTNYRSTKALIDYVNAFCAHDLLLGDNMQTLEVGRMAKEDDLILPAGRSPVELVGVGLESSANADAKRRAEAEMIAEHFTQLHRGGIGWGDMTVLVRRHADAQLMFDVLEEKGIAGSITGGKSFYNEPVIRELTALLRLIRNPHDDQAFVTVALSAAGNLSDTLLAILGQLTHQRDENDRRIYRSLFEAMQKYVDECDDEDDNRQNATHFLAVLDRSVDMIGRYPISDIITLFYRDRGVFALWDTTGAESEREKANYFKFMRIIDAFCEEDTSLIDLIKMVENAYEEGLEESIGLWVSKDTQRVNIQTVHKAKGLQFPVVAYLMGANMPKSLSGPFAFYNDERPIMQQLIEETIDTLEEKYREEARVQWARQTPGAIVFVVNSKDSDHVRNALYQLFRHVQFTLDHAESKRLFYVASTRAKDHLIVTYHASKGEVKPTTRNLGHVLTQVCEDGQDSPTFTHRAVEIEQIDELTDAPARSAIDKADTATAELTLLAPSDPPTHELTYKLVQISASQILAYSQCRWKYWWTYGNRLSIARETVLAFDEESELLEQSSASHRGTVLHKLFEVMGETTNADGEALDRTRIGTIMNAYGVPQSEHAQIEAALETYRSSDILKEIRVYEHVHHEYQFYTAIDSYYLFGYMDVLAVDSRGNVLIVDYKISDSKEDKSKTYAKQALIYAFVALAQGAASVRVVFTQISAESVFEHGAGTFTADDIDTLRAEILTDIDKMQRIQTEQPADPIHALCAYCAVPHSLCSHSKRQ